MKNTAILVTTFLRDNCLFRCVDSVRQFYPDIPVYIGDNGYHTQQKQNFCKDYECEYLELPFDCGVGGTRNEALSRLPENIEYLVVVEDDCVFTKETKLENWHQIFQKDSKIGIVGGLLKLEDDSEQHYEGYHRIEGNIKFADKVIAPRWHKAGNAKFFYCDLVLNVFMMRLAMWRGGSSICQDAIRWDPQFKTALEHADFFIAAKYKLINGHPIRRRRAWKIAYTPDVWMYHRHDCIENREYQKFRGRTVGFQLFGEKWGLTYSFSDYNHQNPMVYKGNKRGRPDFDVRDFMLKTAIEILNKHKIKWWLMSGSCLGAIRENDYIAWDSDIDIGIAPGNERYWNRIKSAFAKKGIALYKEWHHNKKKIELTFQKYGTKLDLFFYKRRDKDRLWYGAFGPDRFERWGKFMEFMPRSLPKSLFTKLKKIKFRGMNCYVPNPPERFLEEIYGDWKTPRKHWRYWRDNRAIDRELMDRSITVFALDTWDKIDREFLENIKKLGNRFYVGIFADPEETFEERFANIKKLGLAKEIIKINSPSFARDLQRLGFIPDYYVSHPHDDRNSLEYLRTFGCEIILTADLKKKTMKLPRRTDRKDKIAIGIKTFMREENFFRTIRAIKEKFPFPYRLYIADDGDISGEKEDFYESLEAEGHKIIRMPFNMGISAGRNAIVAACKEDYVLIMDDDIDINSPEAIRNMMAVLDSAYDIGIVAGVLRHEKSNLPFGNDNYSKGIDLCIQNGVLYRQTSSNETRVLNGVSYRQATQAVNFFLAKREVFNAIRWDNNIKVEWEHMDFFLELQKTPWRVMVCSDAPAIHMHMITNDFEYAYFRRRAPKEYFYTKHGISNIVDYWKQGGMRCQTGA